MQLQSIARLAYNQLRSGPTISATLSTVRAMSSGSAPGAATAGEEVLLTQQGGAAIIELNRPKALNALNLSMIRAIYPQLLKWEADDSVDLIIIKGAGDKAFCAGGDVRAVVQGIRTKDAITRDFFREEYMLNHAIGTCKKPYVAMIDGITMGGGVGLSVHGDFRIATERTLFAMPETNIGLFPDVGGGYFLPRMHAHIGIFLALTGFRLRGEDVRKCGIASHFVNSEDLPQLQDRLAHIRVGSVKGPESIGKVAELLHEFEARSSLDMQRPFVLHHRLADIDRHFCYDSVKEIVKSLADDAGNAWANEQLHMLRKMSPTSLHVSLRQMRNGQHLTLAQVLQMEYRLSQRCTEDHDFAEGVQAALVDKGREPKWNPATIEAVTEDKLTWYFSPLPQQLELQLDLSRE